MTKQQLLGALDSIRAQAAALDNALARSDMVASIEKLASAIRTMPEPEAVDIEAMTRDYRIARKFVEDEWDMRKIVFKDRIKTKQRKLAECNAAGQALNRLAHAHGVTTSRPPVAYEPPMRQAPLIERRAMEVMG